MSASAHIIQLVRAHYAGNESAFTSAAMKGKEPSDDDEEFEDGEAAE